VRDLTDSSENAQNTYDYYAFGKAYGSPTENVTQSFRFTGRRWEPERSEYFYRFRNYDSVGGRFLQRDPIGYEGGICLYVYVKSDPVALRDPLGLIHPVGLTDGLGGAWWGGPPSKDVCCCKEEDLVAYVLVGQFGCGLREWYRKNASQRWALAMVGDLKAQYSDVRLIADATVEDLKRILGEECTAAVHIIGHGTGKGIRPFTGGMDWDEGPGIKLDRYFSPEEVGGWRKSPCLSTVGLYACEQAVGRRRQWWQDAFGSAVDVQHPWWQVVPPNIFYWFQWPLW